MTLSLRSFTRFWLWAVSLLVLLLGANLLAQAQTIRYAKPTATGTGNGDSWANASSNLQVMISLSGAGDQVWVARGTYKPTSTDRSISFTMKNGVAIYGGFTGSETALSQRVLSNPLATILSGDIGTVGNATDNSYHVINNGPGLTNSAVLDGFVITGGNANYGKSPDDEGGGMLNNGSGAGNSCNPLIRNCLFQDNRAANQGGALYNAGYTNGTSNPILINCTFQNNTANGGGAIFNDGSVGGNSNPILINCSFLANSGGSSGAMGSVGYQGNSRPVLTNCVVWGNGGAGTFANGPGSSVTTSYSLFESSATGYNAGTGNLTTTTSPFLSATDARFNACSPGINTGDNAAYTSANGPAADLAGNARVFPSGGRIDMGAYEYQAAGGLSLPIPRVNTATVGVFFSLTFTASGGISPYGYSVVSGSPPPGLSLAPTGILSGTPTQTGDFSLTVKATDATGCSVVSASYAVRVAPASPIRYVQAGASGSGNSWGDASGNLQSQINFTGAQQVWVAQGTYKPTTTTGPDSRTISFSMKNGVAIYGGFAGTETSLAQRNPTSLTTVLSGNIGDAGTNTDNTIHVFNHPDGLNLNNTAVLDGFVIRDGYDTGQNSPGITGGGMSNYSSSPTIANCSFLDNTSQFGGGMGNTLCNPVLTNCIFRGNTATITGGGLYNIHSSSPTLTNCSFVSNSAQFSGGMGNDDKCSPTLTNCSFVNNTASDTGGGMGNTDTSQPTLINCSFLGNASGNSSGGGMYNRNSDPTLTNCVLFGNGGANTFSTNTRIIVTYSLLETAVTNYVSSPTNLTTTVSPFVSATDARLNGCSPAINTGLNSANSTATDLAGNPRIYQNGRIDMGAYEYQAAPTVTLSAPSMSTATVDLAFSQAFVASGGSGPYSYDLASGSLPTGLSLASTGRLSGTPTQAGSFTLTIKATDATGCPGASAAYVLTVAPAPPIRYVRAGASGSGNSWADASGNLQSQINVAGTHQVWVAQGTYKPTTGTDQTISFSMKNGVIIYGGFAGTETSLAQRNPTNLTTVLSGDIGNADNENDNTFHVFNHPSGLNLNNTAVLDGFVIRDGYNPDRSQAGGGMYNYNSSPTIANCSFLNNFAYSGSGMYNDGISNPVLSNCSFRDNFSLSGGGMYNNSNSNPVLTNCSFVGNSAQFGGGINNANYSSPVLTNCSFVNNTAFETGGGMGNYNYSTPTLINCSFLGNASGNSSGAGGIYNDGTSNPVLTNCVLFGNGGANTFSTNTRIIVTYSLLETAVTNYVSSPTNLTTTVSPFVSATDARLNGCSPAINTGLNSANSTATDLAGNPRVYQNGRIDMGAYEYQAAPTVTLSAPSVSTATVGVGFSQTFVASGGSGPYSYRLARGSLLPGLSLASTGTLSGTPTQAGSITLTVLATDAAGCSGASAPYMLTTPIPTLSGLTASPGAVCVGIPVTFTATVSNVTGSYNYTLTNGLGTPLSGTASGTSFRQSVIASGTGPQTFTLTVGNANGQSAPSVTALTVNPLPVASLTNNGPLSCTTTSVTLTTSGGNSYTFTSVSGVIGTPGAANTVVVSTPGTYSVTVASASGCVRTTSTTVISNTAVVTVSKPATTPATINVFFSLTFTASGGTSPYSYSLASGSLPPGMGLATTGTLSGTPTQAGSSTITVKATDATGCSGVSAAYVLTVDPVSPIRFVRAGASGSGNSWADASGNLQSQINFAGIQQVWVARGTYKPTTTTGPASRTVSFTMKNGVAIYGGFAGSETSMSQRVLGNPLATILSGDIGTVGNSADNSYHVISNPPGLTTSAVLDGFVITGGNANSRDDIYDLFGGGMYNAGYDANVRSGNVCSPTVSNCSFQSNSANSGGAMYNDGFSSGGTSNPVLTNCSFQNNSANSGGAMYNDGSSSGTSNPVLTNCSFQNNSATYGGAMRNDGSISGTCSPVLTNCVLFGNGGNNSILNDGSIVSATYSLFETGVTGYTDGPTNLNTTISPFVSATDARLNGCSPAINTGLNSANSTATDLAGNPRVYQNGRIDMGAYEYQAAPTLITTTAPSVSTARVGVAFSQAFVASGGSGPYSYRLASGSLPPGLGLASTGTLSGTPTQVGSFTITVKANDAIGCSGVSAPYVLTVNQNSAPTVANAIPPQSATVGVAFSYTIPANTFTDAETPNSLTLAVSGLPAGLSFVAPGTISGTVSASASSVYSVTVVASDLAGGSVSTLLSLSVVSPGGNCSNMSSLKAGSWDDVSVWSCGRVPLLTDVVTLNHAVRLPASYQGQAQRLVYAPGGRLLLDTNSRLRLGSN